MFAFYIIHDLWETKTNSKVGLKGLSKSPSYLLKTKTVLVDLMLQPYDCTHLTNGYFLKKNEYTFLFSNENNQKQIMCNTSAVTLLGKKMFIYPSKLELNRLQNYSSDCSEKICKVRYAFK